MRGSDERFAKAQVFELLVFSELKAMGFKIALNGTEHTLPEFTSYLRESEDPTSLMIRFEPDGVIAGGTLPRSWYVESKNSPGNLERLAYEQYMKRQEQGAIVVIVFNFSGQKLWGFVEELHFLDSATYVSHYPNPFPVVDGWITPRRARHWGNIKWQNLQASGTAYKIVDRSCLHEWEALKPAFKEALI